MLLEEEMRRSLEFCLWKEQWWKEHVDSRMTSCPLLQEGVRAYALEQCGYERRQHLQWSERIRARGRLVSTQLTETGAQDIEEAGLPPILVELPVDNDTELDLEV